MPDDTVAAPDHVGDLGCDGAEKWAISLLTAAHYGMDEYVSLMSDPPPGGITSLASLALAALYSCGDAKGLEPGEALRGLAVALQ